MSDDLGSIQPGTRRRSRAYPRSIVEVASLGSVGVASIVRFVVLTDAAGRETGETGECYLTDFVSRYEPLGPDGHATELERLTARVDALERTVGTA